MASEIANVSSAWPESLQTQEFSTSQLQITLPDILTGWSTWQYLVTFLISLVIYDQVVYLKRKGSIAGPTFKIPLIGPFIQAIDPKFESYLAQWASGPLSCVSVFHKFVVLASDRDIAHKIFKSPTYAEPCIVPIAKDILGEKAWVFLQGKAHTEYRRGLTPLFTNRALSSYLPVQEKVFSDYFEKFVATSQANQGQPKEFMTLFREINCAISCRTFFGDYISQDAVKNITEDFYVATAALELVNIPLSIYVPFTKCWLGKRAAEAVHIEFAKCAAVCKEKMALGSKPTCIVDHWVLHMMESNQYRERIAAGEKDVEKPSNLIREFSNEEIGETLFTFLFASQDASSSASTWLFQILAQRPDVLDRLREENLAARGGDKYKSFDLPMLESLTYTNAVIKEILRHRPPVIFVPYLATRDFPVTPNYTVSKGSMIIPSCYPALHDPEAYPNPNVFDPDRWISGNAEAHTKNWLVFGAGAHDCLARRYVPLSMAAMIGKAALELDWEHHATPQSEEIRVFATLFPMDGCQLVFKRRFILGGHTNTYVDPATGVTVDYGVEIFHNQQLVKNYFDRLNVSWTIAVPSFGSSAANYLNSSAQSIKYERPDPSEGLVAYAKQLAKYPSVEQGFFLPDPIPEDLLLPFGQFLVKYPAIGNAAYAIFTYGQGLGDFLTQPTLYVFKNFGLDIIQDISTGFLVTTSSDNYKIYDQATEVLGSDVLFNGQVVSTQRRDDHGIELDIETPTGTQVVIAKKLLIAIPQNLNNMNHLNLDTREANLFGEFDNTGYYTSLVKNTGLPENFTSYSVSSDTPYSLPKLPGVYTIFATAIEGVFDIKYGSPHSVSDDFVQAEILSYIKKLQANGYADQVAGEPEFVAYKSHTPFELTVSRDKIANGFYEDLYSLQGHRNTWYTGAAFHTQDSSMIWNYTESYVLPELMK